MTPNFSDITYFIEVAQCKNISRASERLGITQPSVSAAVKRLEDSLGTILLIRSRSGVQLTKAGSELASKGRVLLQSWEQLSSEIKKRENEVSGRYIIGCHPSVALYSLPHFLPQLMQQHANLEIELTHDLSRKITEQVIRYEVDFGVVVNPIEHPDLVIKPLCSDEVSFWVTKKSSSTQCLDPNKGILICDLNLNQVKKLLADLKRRKMGVQRIVHSSNLEVICDLTASGLGVGILPQRVATRIPSHQLKRLTPDLPVFKDKICLVYRADAQKTHGGKVIAEAIKNSFF